MPQKFSNEEINKAYLLAALSRAISGDIETVPTGNLLIDTLEAFSSVNETDLAEALKVARESESLSSNKSSKDHPDDFYLNAAKGFLAGTA